MWEPRTNNKGKGYDWATKMVGLDEVSGSGSGEHGGLTGGGGSSDSHPDHAFRRAATPKP